MAWPTSLSILSIVDSEPYKANVWGIRSMRAAETVVETEQGWVKSLSSVHVDQRQRRWSSGDKLASTAKQYELSQCRVE